MSTPYEPRPHPGTWPENRGRVLRRWTVPLHWVEWAMRVLAYYLSRWSLLEVLEYAGRFTVLIAVVIYFSEAPSRRKQKHYQAWQVINSAAGKTGNGGRLDALQELNEDHISLVAVDVTGAFLQGLQLPAADLHFARLHDCDLRNCDLHGGNLTGADLAGANLRNGNLRDLDAADANLMNTDLTEADATGTNLEGADLSHADLRELKWKGIAQIKGANVHGVENAPAGFIDWAMAHGAISIGHEHAVQP